MSQTRATPGRIGPGALLRLLLLAGIWGCSFFLIKIGLQGLGPSQIALGRLLLGVAVLTVVVAVRRTTRPAGRRTWLHLVVVGVLANVVPFFLFGWGEQRISSGLAGIYNAATPLFTLLVAMAVLPEERPSSRRLVGLVVGFFGVVTVLAPWTGVGSSSLTGQLACLAAGACYGVAIVYTRRFLSGSGFSPLSLAWGQLAAATGLLLAAAPAWLRPAPRLTPHVLLAVLVLGAVGTGIAYLIFYGLIGEIGATRASTVTYLVPIVAVAVGVAVLGEHIGWNDFAGAGIVVLGIAVAEGRLRARLPVPLEAE